MQCKRQSLINPSGRLVFIHPKYRHSVVIQNSTSSLLFATGYFAVDALLAYFTSITSRGSNGSEHSRAQRSLRLKSKGKKGWEREQLRQSSFDIAGTRERYSSEYRPVISLLGLLYYYATRSSWYRFHLASCLKYLVKSENMSIFQTFAVENRQTGIE